MFGFSAIFVSVATVAYAGGHHAPRCRKKWTDSPIGSPTKEQLANLGSFAGMDPEGYFVIKFPGKIDLDFNLAIDLAHNLPLGFSSQVVI